MSVPQQVGAQTWGQAVGERLLWMVKGDQQVAELKITPPNLGPLEVKLTINNEQASVSFVSNHAAVRDALEAAIPRLREMMEQDSLQLVNVDVGARGHKQQAGDGDHPAGDPGTGANGALDDSDTDGAVREADIGNQGQGLVDLFV